MLRIHSRPTLKELLKEGKWWQPTPVFLPGNLMDRGSCGPWGQEELDMTEQLMHTEGRASESRK